MLHTANYRLSVQARSSNSGAETPLANGYTSSPILYDIFGN